MRSSALLIFAFLLTACSGATPAPSEKPVESQTPPVAEEAAPTPIPEGEIGLGRYELLEASAPVAVVDEASEPGEGPRVPAATPVSAPMIPHGIADLDPITRSDNACVDCHEVKTKEEGEPTPMPPSHYTDLRNAPDTAAETVEGARWICVSCHLARTDQAPVVGNSYSN